ncbi:SMI1/KNR4 family protein [Pokkaliibacter sp. MBI-7]|uniref:SMI1/KNR4 family protein n=1 Tax=Pokkaliibacter sp. MBI-7 TaxID=3040600 RepID=UPI00244C43A4|nr:SMI1/KNR4 family protein [Pokkaliibacter sp. MBI-7]MDH2433787.1 SMI1/KNR4 family protein [Pokkaliibacter sp. MBI-7]
MDKNFVLEKLQKKQKLDPGLIGFGVQRHRYELRLPINESRLEKLEEEYGITLPEDYRNFILNISNGGAGPGYGLYSIEEALARNGDEIKELFIRPDEINEEQDDHLKECGMLILCQHGCANDDFLILNGTERGFVWEYIDWVGHHIPLSKNMPKLSSLNNLPQEEHPEAKKKWVSSLFLVKNDQKMTFSDWYIDWLEQPPRLFRGTEEKKDKKRSWLTKWLMF